jgi:hypothetical protein
MSAYSRHQQLAAYQSVAAHGGIAQDDPHRLVLMLMDGAQQRIQAARGCIERGDRAQKVQLLQRALAIVDELRASSANSGPVSSLLSRTGRSSTATQACSSSRLLSSASACAKGSRARGCGSQATGSTSSQASSS